ncbi:hypothetical protein MKX01_016926 [Papaver californicum]|nr:hypothetical protein MKX01_016926 [Papaver californicum]
MEVRRSNRASKPVLKQEEIDMAEEAVNNALRRNGRGRKEKGSTSSSSSQLNKKRKTYTRGKKKDEKPVKRVAEETEDCKLTGEPVPDEEAKTQWPERYDLEVLICCSCFFLIQVIEKKKKNNEEILIVKSHYSSAEVDGITYLLNEDAYVKSDEEEVPYICRINEFFKTTEGHVYFTPQWYYRPSDTVMGVGTQQSDLIQKKRVFFSDVKNDNPLECLVGKPIISMIPHNVDLATKQATIASSDFYCDMFYKLPYSTFIHIPPGYASEKTKDARNVSSGLSSDTDSPTGGSKMGSNSYTAGQLSKSELSLLDSYAGCGAMSSGLCLGAKVGDVNLITRWALDLNESACKSLALNHPETKVTNDCGENFLSLLREWERLCHQYNLLGTESEDFEAVSKGELQVEEIVGISFGDPGELDKAKKSRGKGKKDVKIPKGTELHFKVHWKGYDSSEDTWEPLRNLSNCEEKIHNFVTAGYHSNLLPLPWFQFIRNEKNPLDDEKNYQMVVYMDIVEFLKPPYILMENVVDLVQFSEGFLARYAMSRLVSMGYQVRLGIMAAGSFGLPQFRQRVFLWGAQLGKKLPPYPLPTHEAVVRYGVPKEFDMCLVAYDETVNLDLENPLFLLDALSGLPEVRNGENCDTMPYGSGPQNDFQQYIRSNRTGEGLTAMLYDHIPLELNTDDYQRVCRIPREKGAFFRDLGGVIGVIVDGKEKWALDPSVPREYLASGKPLVPDYALTFSNGNSNKPFARL